MIKLVHTSLLRQLEMVPDEDVLYIEIFGWKKKDYFTIKH